MRSALDQLRFDLNEVDPDDRAVGVWTNQLRLAMNLIDEVVKLPPSVLPKEVNSAINALTEIEFE